MNKPSSWVMVSLMLSVSLSLAGCLDFGDDDDDAPVGGSSNDPLYTDQWHLKNTGQAGGVAGEDINVESVWASYKGTGIRIAIVDDGLEIAHEDLQANVISGASYDYTVPGGGTDPTGGEHGTAVAGVAAAVGYNNIGVRGVAPSAGLVGYNLLQNSTDTNEADAMTRGTNDVNSNSWGPQDGTGLLIGSTSIWRSAIESGLSSGRAGKGIAYTWAAGNGGTSGRDNSNYDGYANYRGVMAIAALLDDGTRAPYSELGANLWVGTPSGDSCATGHTTTTVDRSGALGYNNGSIAYDYTDANYTKCFNGTSSATPVASGAIALMLEANSAMTWRDVRIVLAQTAEKNHAADSDWTTNGAGYNINHKYGFGRVDAAAAVTAAETWTNVPSAVNCNSMTGLVNTLIPDNNATGVTSIIDMTGCAITDIEWVDVTFTSNHTYAGDLEIVLTSPAGTVSRLAEVHVCRTPANEIISCGNTFSSGWRFGSARHLGESAVETGNGNWTLRVKDLAALDTGTFQYWQLKVYGR